MATKSITPASIRDILDNIKKGTIDPIYLIHGEEESQINEFLGLILDEVLPKEFRDGNFLQADFDIKTFRDNRDFLDTMPFLAPRRVVVFNDCPFIQLKKKLSEDMKSLMDEIKQLIEYDNPTCVTFFLFWVDDGEKRWLDKRSSFYKFIQKEGQIIETEIGFKLGTLMNAVASRKLDDAILILNNLYKNTSGKKKEKLPTLISKRFRESLQTVITNADITNAEIPNAWYYDFDQREALRQFQRNFQQSQLLIAYESLFQVEDRIRPRKNTEIISENPLDIIQGWMTRCVEYK